MIIEIWTKEKYSKNEELDLIGRLSHAGVKPDFAKISRLYRIDADFKKKDFEKIAREILIDPITEEYSFSVREFRGDKLGDAKASTYVVRPFGADGTIYGAIGATSMVVKKGISHSINLFRVEVWLKDSVTDVIGESVQQIISDVIHKKPENVRFGHAYYFSFDSETRLKHAVSKTLTNELVHFCRIKKYGKSPCKI